MIVLLLRHRSVLECHSSCLKGGFEMINLARENLHQASGPYSQSYKYLYFSLDRMLDNRATLSIKCTSTHSYTWAERGTVSVHVKSVAQHKAIQVPSQGSNLNSSGLKPVSSALTIRPMCPWVLKRVSCYCIYLLDAKE